MLGCSVTSGSSPYFALASAMLRLMTAVSSQCAMMGSGDVLNNFSSASVLSTSIFPVDEPMNSFTPGTSCGSNCDSSAVLSLVAPKKNEWLTWLFVAARANFSARVSSVVVCGTVLGMSKNVVTPPAAAARLSLSMSALSVRPGSRKCTWVSITPGITIQPEASIVLSNGASGCVVESDMPVIVSPSMVIEPLRVHPSFTISAFFISVLILFLIVAVRSAPGVAATVATEVAAWSAPEPVPAPVPASLPRSQWPSGSSLSRRDCS